MHKTDVAPADYPAIAAASPPLIPMMLGLRRLVGLWVWGKMGT